MPSRRVLAALTLAATVGGVAALAGCDDGSSAANIDSSSAPTTAATTAEPVNARFPTYVALGDSYTAAPGVPETEQQSGCFRSSGNYPSLVAAELKSELVDVSCSGATTLALVGAQDTGGKVTPAQFSALTPATALVTLGIGGNDLDLFQTLIGTCGQLGSSDPQGSPCRDQMQSGGKDLLVEKIGKIGARVTSAVRRVRDRAPQATIVLVGYPQAVPAKGTCDILPLAKGDYAYVRSVTEDLNDAMRAAASKGKATYVDVGKASAGHDICAGPDAWVNGMNTDITKAIAFHPFAAEQQAVADLILGKLS